MPVIVVKPAAIRKRLSDGRWVVGLDSKGQPATDHVRITGWAYEADSLPVYAGGKAKRKRGK